MDARGVLRLLERIQGLADTAEHLGVKYVETMHREPRLSDAAKAKLELLYREHALRVTQLHSMLGLAICEAIQGEMDDVNAHGQLDRMRETFQALNDRSRDDLVRAIGAKVKLG